MEAYTGFAEVYDSFMDNVPYDAWEEIILDLLRENGVRGGLLLELGCGTGIMTERLAARGYDMIGVDISEDMLSAAIAKRAENGSSTLYLCQDMREFELYGTVAAIYSICDSLNYITEPEDVTEVFRLVNNYLDPEGVYVFDFTTPAYYQLPERGKPIVDEQDGVVMIWENEYDPETKLNDHCVTFFRPVESPVEEEWDCDGPKRKVLNAEDEPLYRKVQELHEQRAYTLPEIRAALSEAGLIFVAAYDADSRKEPTDETCRIICVARENGKQA